MKTKLLFVLLLVLLGCAGSGYMELGMYHFNKGDIKTAEECFKACLSEDPACANNLGVIYWNRGERQRAVNLWIYAARMDVPAARTNLVNLAGIQPPPVDPQVFYERQRAYDALGQAAYNAGAAIGGATNDSGSYRAPQHTFGIMTPTGMESWNVRTGEKVIQYNNPDGSYDTYSFGGRK